METEAQWIGGRTATDPKEQIDFQPLLAQGRLEQVDLDGEAEELSFINFAAENLGDGEAISAAIALHRGWTLAIDDGKARKVFAQFASGMQMTTTVEVLKHWADTANMPPDVLRAALQDVEIRGPYKLKGTHPLFGWWQGATTTP